MSMNEPAAATTDVLGHADIEIQRLLLQGRLYNDHTEHALRLAGLRPGMRVLDVGCGPGDISFVAARLVGPAGPCSASTPQAMSMSLPAPAPPSVAWPR